MTARATRGVTFVLGLLLALTHVGCSEEFDLETASGATHFEFGETVEIRAFDGKTPMSAAELGTVRLRWSVHNPSHGGHVDLGSGAVLFTSQLRPGTNYVTAWTEDDRNYRFPPSGGIAIHVSEASPPTPAPTLGAAGAGTTASAPATAPEPGPAVSSDAGSTSGPTAGLIHGLSGE